MKVKKIIAALLAFVLIVPCSACFGKKHELSSEIIVSEDDPWYDTVRFKIEQPDLGMPMRANNIGTFFKDGKIYSINQMTDPNAYWETDSYISIYDLDGNSETLKVEYDGNAEDDEHFVRMNAFSVGSNGQATALVERMSTTGYDFATYFADIDLNTGKASELQKIEAIGTDFVVTESVSAGDFMVVTASPVNSNEGMSYFFYEGHELVTMLKAKDIVDNSSWAYMNSIVPVPGTDHLLFNGAYEGGVFDAEIDPRNNTILSVKMMTYDEYFGSLQKNEESETDAMKNCSVTIQGEYMRLDNLGNIYSFDKDTKESKVVIGCNSYNPYYSDYLNSGYDEATVFSHDENMTVLRFAAHYGTVAQTSGASNSCEEVITVLKKCETNPHAGKKVIEIDDPMGCSDYLSQAIYEFNNTDDEYLIRVWSQNPVLTNKKNGFISNNVLIGQAGLTEDQVYLEEMLQLADGTDIPDIVLNMRDERGFTEDRFVDLKDYIDKDVREMLYTNMLDATLYDGKAYFLPTAVCIKGIVAPVEDVGEGRKGFTFDEYKEFVAGPCNGVDPFAQFYYDDLFEVSDTDSRFDFLMACINTGDLINGSKADLDTEGFRAAAEFSRNDFVVWYYGDPLSTGEDTGDTSMNFFKETPAIRYWNINRYSEYAGACRKSSKDYAILGAPSVDGAGAGFGVTESLSLASASEVKDGVRRFINFMYKGDFEDKETLHSTIMLNKEVFRREADGLNKYINSHFAADLAEGLPYDVLQSMGLNMTSDIMPDNFVDSLSQIDRYIVDDREIYLVMKEELSPYLSGEKPLDDVIKVCNDRISKIKSERQ